MKNITISICLLLILGCGENKPSTEVKEETPKDLDTTSIDICYHKERQVLPTAIELWKYNYKFLQEKFTSGNTNSATSFIFNYEMLTQLFNSNNTCSLMEVVYYMGDHDYGNGEIIHCPMVAIGSIYKDSLDSAIYSDSLLIASMGENGGDIFVSRAGLATQIQEWQDFSSQHSDILIWVKTYTYKWETVLDKILQANQANPEDLNLQIDMIAHTVSPYSIMYSVPSTVNEELVEGYYAYDILATRKDAVPSVEYSLYDFAAPCPPYCGSKE